MRLTSFTNYALRVLMFAAVKGETLSSVHEISDSYGISRAHLVKCVHMLGRWGYLKSFRGRNGGFRLALAPDQITVGEIVRHTEEGLDLVECFNPETNTCPLIEVCRLKLTFQKGLMAFLEVLDSVSVADLVVDKASIATTLEIETKPVAAKQSSAQ